MNVFIIKGVVKDLSVETIFKGVWPFVIALPSVIWCGMPALVKYRKKNDVSYYWLYCEGWANLWGARFSNEKFKGAEMIKRGHFGKPLKKYYVSTPL